MPTDLLQLTTTKTGALGDRVHTRNQYGQYDRPRIVPADPNTPRQQRVRSRWADIVPRWTTDLTRDQRLDWIQYARQLNLQDLEGDVDRLTGQTAFIRANVSRQSAALGLVLDPPATFTNSPVGRVTVNGLPGLGQLGVNWVASDSWCSDNGGALIVFVGADQPIGNTFFKGPWRRSAIIRGNQASPPSPPRVVLDPFAPETSFNRWQRHYTIRGDGRVSPSIQPHFI